MCCGVERYFIMVWGEKIKGPLHSGSSSKMKKIDEI